MGMFKRSAACIAAVFFVSACVPETGIGTALGGAFADDGSEATTPPPVQKSYPVTTQAPLCSAVVHGWLKGQSADAAASIAEPKRIIPPGSAITMDHNPSRTNFDLGTDGKITRVWCG